MLERQVKYFSQNCDNKWESLTDRLEEIASRFEDIVNTIINYDELVEIKTKLEDIENTTIDYDELEEMYNKVTKHIDKMQICQQFSNLTKRKMYDYISFVIKELYDFFNYIHDECRRGKTVYITPSSDTDTAPSYTHDGIICDEDEWSVSVEEISEILERIQTLNELWRMKIDVVRTTFRDFVQINDMISEIGYFVNKSWRVH